MKNLKYSFIYILLLLSSKIFAQIPYESFIGNIYDYLDEMSIKHIVDINSEVKPYSRKYIETVLKNIDTSNSRMNQLELDELKLFKNEYSREKDKKFGDYYFYNYSDSVFSICIYPQIGYSISQKYNEYAKARWWGGYIYSEYSDWFSASLSFRDNGEYGKTIDKSKNISPERGYFINKIEDGWSEFNDVSGSINFNWRWGSVSIVKDYQRWGHGEFGQLILSDNVSSYPQIRLFLKPTEWLRFYYIHGWLTSNVPDSINFYPTGIYKLGKPVLRKEFKEKYIASNFFSFDPWNKLTISLGNSVIYSDYLKPEFFIPFLIYKFQDHNAGRNNDYGSNGQLFGDFCLNYPINYRFYGTFFLDMTSITELLKDDSHSTWLGYTLGIKRTDLLLKNLELSIEYTKISPWVYEHYIPTTTYKHLDYTLGHWIGQNADYFRLQFDYKLIRGLNLSMYFERLRKGGMKDISIAYQSDEKLPFLYGPLRKDYYLGFVGQYEFLYGVFAKINYVYSNISDEDPNRTQEFMLGKKHNFEFQLSCGF